MPQVSIDEFLKEDNGTKRTSPLSYLRAKSGENNALLIDHVKSALGRCVELYEFIENLNGTVTYKPLGNPEERFELFKGLAKAIIIHDLGKITLDFQRRLYGKGKLPEELREYLTGSESIRARHEILSVLWSAGLLGNSEQDAKIRTAVLLHHYNEFFSEDKEFSHIVELYPDDIEKYLSFLVSKKGILEEFLRDYIKAIESEFKEDFIKKAVAEMTIDFSHIETIKEKVANWDDDLSEEVSLYNPESFDVDFLVFLGMLRRCDYSSSGNFEIEKSLNLLEVFDDVNERIRRKILEKLRTHEVNFGGLWQEELLSKKDSDYLVVVAPTGSGKTELGILWARKKGKLLYTLPLRVALNDLYKRLSEEYFDKDLVGLLHSTAFMEYVEGSGSDIEVEKKVNAAGLLAMPVMLSTPDQVFLTGLNYYGADKVISVYPESAIVVDEVQAYTPEMTAVFLKTLRLIKEAGGKVLVITATLPPHIEYFLRREGFEIVDVLEESKRHGLNVKNLRLKRHHVKLVEGNLFKYTNDGLKFEGLEKVLSAIEEFEKQGFKSTMVVLNNVKKAIEAYKLISKQGNGWEVYLLHSRLPERKKAEVILRVKSSLEKGKKVVLVATQVVEASVDLDFDAMITEISPIDSQVQRWGRVYRNRKTDYTGAPNIIVFSGVDRGTRAVYGRKIGDKVLQKTAEVIGALEGRTLGYEDERDTIEKVYRDEILQVYRKQVGELLEKLDYFTLEKKSEAQRVFRQMAGMYFVVPALMGKYGYNKTVKKFGELLSDPKNLKLSWSDITQKLSQELGHEVGKWELRKMLQEFSVNVPIWFVLKDGNLRHALHNTFKGYPVIVTWDKNKAEMLWDHGVDEVIGKDLDDVEDIL
ncbi:CRISPR-associated helicase/endonuclease Cas3 [Thermococcus sp. AM4]|uniref:CRISPR-associated helicase/endonuclease Cas3 n=1 Tax=Thermococcus sp. (strain AM4) TaxID=246969 RepID=UPI0001870DE1|nr:CRISPR-associated helicase/endonuclease Cas3 [Thermococcus sp. AM4]EEB73318.1 CRISPR-associated helicase Cas3 [Thermococcus sp. AM4]